jgi:hypothetical protein
MGGWVGLKKKVEQAHNALARLYGWVGKGLPFIQMTA